MVFAVFLVGTVAAVVVVIADIVLRYTVMIVAGEVVEGTSGIIAVFRFVGSVDAVFV